MKYERDARELNEFTVYCNDRCNGKPFEALQKN